MGWATRDVLGAIAARRIASSYPILFVFLARLIFKEPLLPRQAWGIALSRLGILALALLA